MLMRPHLSCLLSRTHGPLCRCTVRKWRSWRPSCRLTDFQSRGKVFLAGAAAARQTRASGATKTAPPPQQQPPTPPPTPPPKGARPLPRCKRACLFERWPCCALVPRPRGRSSRIIPCSKVSVGKRLVRASRLPCCAERSCARAHVRSLDRQARTQCARPTGTALSHATRANDSILRTSRRLGPDSHA